MLLHYSDISSVRVVTENGNEMVEKNPVQTLNR